MNALSARWCRAVPSFRAAALRIAFFRVELGSTDVPALAAALDDLSLRSEQADPIAREVLAAALPVLTDADFAARTDELREAAGQMALLALARLLRRPAAPSSPPPPEPDERHLATSPTGRVLTLGERKALARRPSRAALDKLLRDPHPLVIRTLLENPRMTEIDVVRLAARRPAYAEVIAEIARSPEWSQRVRVRMAIVQNPGSPPEIAVPLVRLLIRPELQQVIAAADVPAVVRAAATELLLRRPPVPESHDQADERQ